MSPSMVLPWRRHYDFLTSAPIYNTGTRSARGMTSTLRQPLRRAMARAFRLVAVSLLLLLAACVPPPQEALSGPLPPQPPGMARLIFYRTQEYYVTTAMSTVYLNGNATGVSQIGAVLYRDVAPGRYDLSVFSPRSYPDQFKTIVVKGGDTFYVRIDALPKQACSRVATEACYADTFIVTVVDPAIGSQQ